jgi:Esterase-like activity of phytase
LKDGKVTPQPVAKDPYGYDSEGLVALPDGTFWVSDEYGPYITHFDQWGHALRRLSPLNGTLPVELQDRVANRGLEGLTVTPDGKELVALMQSSLQEPDIDGANAKKLVPLRLITYNLKTHDEHEYLYLLHNPATNATAVSELAALSDTTFLVDERDGCFPGNPGMNPPAEPGAAPTECSTYSGGAFKQLFKIDISRATDVGPDEHVTDPIANSAVSYNATQNATDDAPLGLLINGKSIEDTVLSENKATATQTSSVEALLESNGITPVSSTPYLDVNGLLGSLDPSFGFYSHDKVEGVAVLKGGKELVISNDSDFGITTANFVNGTDKSDGYSLVAKLSPATGQQDNGEYLAVDMSRVGTTTNADGTGTSVAMSGSTSTKTVTIKVTGN